MVGEPCRHGATVGTNELVGGVKLSPPFPRNWRPSLQPARRGGTGREPRTRSRFLAHPGALGAQDDLVAVLEEGAGVAGDRTGACPTQVKSMKAPRVSFSGPEMVPEAKRATVRVGRR